MTSIVRLQPTAMSAFWTCAMLDERSGSVSLSTADALDPSLRASSDLVMRWARMDEHSASLAAATAGTETSS